MPRLLVRASEHDRARSLGWLAWEWMEFFLLHGRGDATGMPVRLGDEAGGFVVDAYALDDQARRLYDSAFYSRPKGCDKSGMLSRFSMFEALGPCRGTGEFARGGEVYRDPWGLGFVHEYAPGEPIGRHIQSPVIRCLATEEEQTGNVYDTIHYNLTEGPLSAVLDRRDDAGLTRVLLPRTVGPKGGQIVPSTASSASKDGGLETFIPYDETHLYNRRELREMYGVTSRNLRKRRKTAGTWYLEGTTMYAEGEDSVAERTFGLAQLIREGQEWQAKHGKPKPGTPKTQRLLLDFRWGDIADADLGDADKLRAALADAYGEAAEYNDLDGLVEEFWDPRKDPADSTRYFLNARSTRINAWMSASEWNGRSAALQHPDGTRVNPAQPPARGDLVVLGFDGSRKRARGVVDATALIACRVSDGLVWPLGIWEQPKGVSNWEIPVADVEAAIEEAHRMFNVAGFLADPALWESQVSTWEARYASKYRVKASQQHPIEWWMTGARNAATVQLLEEFRTAVWDGELIHDGDPTLTRHVLAARMRATRVGVQIAKENPTSERKIDGAIAAALAWRARRMAIAAGATKQSHTFVPSRIR